MVTLWQDIRYSLRMLAKSPGFTAVAVLTLTLGIGANTTVFSFVNAFVLRTMPTVVSQPDRLVWLSSQSAESPELFGLSYLDYLDLRADNPVCIDVMAQEPMVPFVLNGAERPERVWGALVSENFFSLLGVQPTLGRSFTREEGQMPGSRPAVIISHRLWQRRFQGEHGIIGQHLLLNQHSYTVVGVAPERFTSTLRGFSFDVYMPLTMHHRIRPDRNLLTDRKQKSLQVMGRLKPGIRLNQALIALQTRWQQLESEHARPDERTRLVVRQVSEGNPGQTRTSTLAACVGLVFPFLVLLIACVNVANLLLARATTRQKEIAVRAALGASRRRIFRQLLTESLILSLGGGLGGFVLAVWLAKGLGNFELPIQSLPLRADLLPDQRSLLFTLSMSLGTCLLIGLVPALYACRTDLISSLKLETGAVPGPHKRLRLQKVLVMGQVAVCFMLLTAAGLFLRALHRAHEIHPGFEVTNRFTVSIDLGSLGMTDDQRSVLRKTLEQRLDQFPGVRGVTLARFLPLGFSSMSMPFFVDPSSSHPTESVEVQVNDVGRDYFHTMGIQLLRGCVFSDVDVRQPSGVCIINETLARRFWPEGGPVGERVRVGGPNKPLREIIGIVRNSKYQNLGETPMPFLYMPLGQEANGELKIVVWAINMDASSIRSLLQEIRSVNSSLPMFDVKTMHQHAQILLSLARLALAVLETLGILALILASVRLYGVIAFSVGRRIREIGIRFALGAPRTCVIQQVIAEGMLLVFIGLGFGIGGAYGMGYLLASSLYGLSPTDPVTFVGMAVLLAVVGLLACYFPARRAANIDPMEALRYE